MGSFGLPGGQKGRVQESLSQGILGGSQPALLIFCAGKHRQKISLMVERSVQKLFQGTVKAFGRRHQTIPMSGRRKGSARQGIHQSRRYAGSRMGLKAVNHPVRDSPPEQAK
jgi:hypothetical protein